jgi:hypothetical protein
MLQYAAPNAPQTYSRRTSVFTDTPTRSTDTTSPTYDSNTHGYNIPRPPSTLSQGTTTSEQQHRKRSISSLAASSLALDSSPALSQLASLAAQAPAAEMNPNHNGSSDRYVDIHSTHDRNDNFMRQTLELFPVEHFNGCLQGSFAAPAGLLRARSLFPSFFLIAAKTLAFAASVLLTFCFFTAHDRELPSPP